MRDPVPSDTSALLALAVATGLFSPAEAEGLLGGILAALHAGALPPLHSVTVHLDADGEPNGWAYFAPDAHAEGVWELWWIGVSPARHDSGVGSRLLAHVEERAKVSNARVLLIATSSLPALARTRRFYARRGFVECGCIPDFYADGDGKITFAKRLQII